MEIKVNRDDSARASATAGFDYSEAFSRNIGWITEWEQQELRTKTVAIAGMGGVGGAHALTLARLGIGGLHLADFDRFNVVNMNRQAGAFMSTINLEKAKVMGDMTRDINPQIRQKVFAQGVHEGNLDAFLAGVDLFVDGFDFFVMSIRRKAFRRCAELGIPAITAAPIGFGASYLIFMPGGMSFEDYFRLEGLAEERQYVNFALGFTPKGFHRSYLVDPSRIDLAGHRGPSSAAAIQLCAGIVGAEAIKILLKRGKVYAAPAYHQFDAYQGAWKRGYLHWGNSGPLQSLKRRIGYRAFGRMSRKAQPVEMPAADTDIQRILDVARWAPSGDNAQPWRFHIAAADKLIIRIRVEGQARNVYDYAAGQPTLIAGGFLLETIRIAASRFGRRTRWTYLGRDDRGSEETEHVIEISLPNDATVHEDPLHSYITVRSVDRRAYRRRKLTPLQKVQLQAALGGELRIEWRETLAERWKLARLCARSTDIRLRLPETYQVHRRILDWKRRFSPDGIPTASLGADPLMLHLMRKIMRSWNRVQFMNGFPAATVIPQVELDLIPGMFCAGYFVVTREPEPDGNHTPEALLRTGERLQRFWLTATRLGLALQPTLAPLCFAHYARLGSPMSSLSRMAEMAPSAARCLADDRSVLFLGRIGTPQRKIQTTRSIRRKIETFVTNTVPTP